MKEIKRIVFIALAMLFTGVPVFAQFIPGYALQDKTSLWTEDKDGNMNWKMSVAWGTELLVKMDGDHIDAKDAIRISDGQKSKRNFTNVTYEGKQYWVQSDRFSAVGTPRVVVADAAFYYSEDISNPSRFIVPKGAVITEVTTVNVYGVNLKKVNWCEATESYAVKEGYLYASKVGISEDDVKAIHILAKAKDMKDKTSKNEILSNTENLQLSSQVDEWIKIELGFSDFSKGKVEFENFTNEISGYYTVNLGNNASVNVYDIPGFAGNVVTDCSSPWVYVKERSEDMETVNGNTNHWYHITAIYDFDNSSVVDGWIFGSCLSFYSTSKVGNYSEY